MKKKQVEHIVSNSASYEAGRVIVDYCKKQSKTISTTISCVAAGLVFVAGVTVGSLVGSAYASLKNNVDYDAYDPRAYEDDIDALMTKYESTSPSQYKNVFSHSDMVNIAARKYDNEEYTHSTSIGTATATGVTQTVLSHDIKNGHDFFAESISFSSLVKCSSRFYWNDNEDTMKEYKAKKSDIHTDGTADWTKADMQEVTVADHETKWGKKMNKSIIYIISSKTVLSSTLEEKNDNYVISLTLDNVTTVLRYVKQMIALSELDNTPQFEKINLTFTLDKDLNLTQLIIHEEYTVVVVIKNQTVGDLTINYTRGQEAIPDLSTNYHYDF